MRKKVVLLAAIMLAVYGCATPGKESFKLGQELSRQDRLEEAIAMYEDALVTEPDNVEYRSAMRVAKGQLSQKHAQNAKAIMDRLPLNNEQAKAAYQEVEKASRLTPENSDVIKLKSLIKSEMDRIIKEAETMYSEALKAMTENRWTDGFHKLTEIHKIYPDYLDISAKLKQVADDGVYYYLKEAERLKETEDWAEVINVLSSAVEIAPDNADLQARLDEAKARNKPEHYIIKAEEFSAKNEWDTAISLAQKAYDMSLSDDIGQALEKIKRQAGLFYIGRFKQDVSGKRLYGAYSNLRTALNYYPAVKDTGDTVDAVNTLIEDIAARAEAYEAKGYFGNALSWYEKIAELNPKHRGAVFKIQSLKDGIKERIVKKIAIMDFTPPSSKPDVGRIITDNLLSYITSNAGNDVKVLARDVLGAILKEIEYGQAGIYDIETAKKAGKLKGTDIFIFGSVLNYEVDRNVSEGSQMKSVVVGKKSIPNPAYQLWLMSRKGESSGEEDIRNAPPSLIEEEIRETIKYKVGAEKKLATVAVSFRVIDIEEGEVVITKTIKEQREVKDDYSEGASFANVPYDPLEIPMDSELLGDVTQKVVEQLGYMVLSRFQNLQVQYYSGAEMLKKKMEYERALEKYIDSIYIEDIKNISSPLSKNAGGEVEKLLAEIENAKWQDAGNSPKERVRTETPGEQTNNDFSKEQAAVEQPEEQAKAGNAGEQSNIEPLKEQQNKPVAP
ncbi:MAG: hypothetical protein HZA14_10545 [Nitrospirae bacterium]|nr:hypothetical protein [Nitrospirota bacterium]